MSGEQEEEHLGLSYFSLTLKRNIIRETTYVGKSSQLESTAHPGREFTTAGAGDGWSHDPHSQDAERDGCQCSVLFLLLSEPYPRSVPTWYCSHSGWILPPQVERGEKCLPGDSSPLSCQWGLAVTGHLCAKGAEYLGARGIFPGRHTLKSTAFGKNQKCFSFNMGPKMHTEQPLSLVA